MWSVLIYGSALMAYVATVYVAVGLIKFEIELNKK